MRQVYLGDIQRPILIFGGAYSNLQATHALIDAGLDQGYHTALETGYWPSEDVLPMDLRRSVDNG